MCKLRIDKLENRPQYDILRDYFAAIFGPAAIVLFIFLFEQLFEYFNPYVSPSGMDGIVYMWLHTVSLLSILSFGGVVLLRSLSTIRKYLKVPWNIITPPFSTSIDKSIPEVNPYIIKKAKIASITGPIVGAYFAFLLQIIGFVPYRQGMILTGPLGRSAPSVTAPSAIFEIPIISDLVILGDFIASPHTFGYVLVSIAVAPLVVGFWNLTYLFFNYRTIDDQIPGAFTRGSTLLRSMPYVGLLEFIIAVWKFGPLWFFH